MHKIRTSSLPFICAVSPRALSTSTGENGHSVLIKAVGEVTQERSGMVTAHGGTLATLTVVAPGPRAERHVRTSLRGTGCGRALVLANAIAGKAPVLHVRVRAAS
ncbi:hypothetical protein AAFF_G00130940 [Aldrovandia affinis]|uniref:Uncharacterized protein n=1 Tax=Aldrovandia affinis TaxID=143900 RepID=A0AAD7RR76_9TELE|nr:hypothetical protein AAFF_G00130940 [Aldrovandia affinis]